jgi:DNA-binding NtrC family response regulator
MAQTTLPTEGTAALGRILAVDDEPDALFALVAELNKRYAVVAVRDPRAALALSPERFDVILAELHLRKENYGPRFKRALEERQILTPLIFMSADPGLAQAAGDLQAFGFLRKPLDRQELEWVLRAAISPASGHIRAPARPARQQTQRYDVEGLTGRPRPAPP